MGEKNKFNVSHADFEINPGHTSGNVDTLIWFSGEKSGLSICMCVSSACKWSSKPGVDGIIQGVCQVEESGKES